MDRYGDKYIMVMMTLMLLVMTKLFVKIEMKLSGVMMEMNG